MMNTKRQVQAIYKSTTMYGYVVFEDTTGAVYHLRPQQICDSVRAILLTPNATPGFRVTLEYRSGPTCGLWYVV